MSGEPFRWTFSTPCPGRCGQSIATCACLPGAWRCEKCRTMIEFPYPMSWPDHCGQRAEWVSSAQRMKEARHVS